MDRTSKYKAVVISGGGSKGLVSLGVLHHEHTTGRYDSTVVHSYAGTSIGSILSLLLVCGYTPMEIFKDVYAMKHFFDSTSGDDNNPSSVWDIFSKMGLISIDKFAGKIEEFVCRKLGVEESPTLRELYDLTGKSLYITGSNITKMRCDYYSWKTHPNMNCVDAVKMSSNLPVIFQRIKYDPTRSQPDDDEETSSIRQEIEERMSGLHNKPRKDDGHYIIDGGLMDNFPLRCVDDSRIPILGIVSMGSDFSRSDDQFLGYFYRMIVMPMKAMTELLCEKAGPNVKLVRLTYNGAPLVMTEMGAELKMDMFQFGCVSAERFDERKFLWVNGLCEKSDRISKIGDCVSSEDGWDEWSDEGW